MRSEFSTLKGAKRDEAVGGAGSCLSAQFAQELLLVHAVLKRFAAVDEDYGDLVGIAAPDFGVGVNVDFMPGEATMLVQLDEALLDDFAKMTSLAGINHDFPRLRHSRSLPVSVGGFQDTDGRRWVPDNECQTMGAQQWVPDKRPA